jgi:hypothetical protein
MLAMCMDVVVRMVLEKDHEEGDDDVVLVN